MISAMLELRYTNSLLQLFESLCSKKFQPEQVADIQSTCDVSISIRQKANKTTKACVIKGIERHASTLKRPVCCVFFFLTNKLTGNIYKARNLIFGIDEPPIYADIPISYHMPVQASSPAQMNELRTPTNLNPPNLSSPLISPAWYYPSSTLQPQSCPPFVGITQQPHFFPPNMTVNALHHQAMANNNSP